MKKSLASYGTNCLSDTNGHGQFLFWNLNLWPMIIKVRCVNLNLIAVVFTSYRCVPSRGIRAVGKRYFQCGKSWLLHQTHGVFIIFKSYFMMAITKRFLHINKNGAFPKLILCFVNHKHISVICVCDAQISCHKINFVFVNCKHTINL